jgi:hypothetical protein
MSDELLIVTLYRPVGPQELELVRASGYREFPPRLPEQPIFYPVLNEEYARQIARDWNTKASGVGYVPRFQVRREFTDKHEVHVVGGAVHQEYWIAAEELEEFNGNIVGLDRNDCRVPLFKRVSLSCGMRTLVLRTGRQLRKRRR